MRKNFYFLIAIFFWILMVVGFSDNWLFDRGQPSNSDPKYLIHAFFAFSWFTLLVIQTGLVRTSRAGTHMKLGISAALVFGGFFVSTGFIYIYRLIYEARPSALSMLNMALFVFAVFLIVKGLAARNTNPDMHKTNMIVGSFLLMEPGISRSIGHLFGKGSEGVWLLTYLVLFGLFVFHFRRVNWQIGIGFAIWLVGTVNIILSMAK